MTVAKRRHTVRCLMIMINIMIMLIVIVIVVVIIIVIGDRYVNYGI